MSIAFSPTRIFRIDTFENIPVSAPHVRVENREWICPKCHTAHEVETTDGLVGVTCYCCGDEWDVVVIEQKGGPH